MAEKYPASDELDLSLTEEEAAMIGNWEGGDVPPVADDESVPVVPLPDPVERPTREVPPPCEEDNLTASQRFPRNLTKPEEGVLTSLRNAGFKVDACKFRK